MLVDKLLNYHMERFEEEIMGYKMQSFEQQSFYQSDSNKWYNQYILFGVVKLLLFVVLDIRKGFSRIHLSLLPQTEKNAHLVYSKLDRSSITRLKLD